MNLEGYPRNKYVELLEHLRQRHSSKITYPVSKINLCPLNLLPIYLTAQLSCSIFYVQQYLIQSENKAFDFVDCRNAAVIQDPVLLGGLREEQVVLDQQID